MAIDADKVIEVRFDADTKKFLTDLEGVDRKTDQTSKKMVKNFFAIGNASDVASHALRTMIVPAVAQGFNLLTQAVVGTGGAIFAFGAGIAPVTGLLGAMPSLLMGAVQGFSTLKLALSEVGNAVKARTTLLKGSAGASEAEAARLKSLGTQAEMAARQLVSANRALGDAQVTAARHAEDSADLVARAEERVARANERVKTSQERLTLARIDATEKMRNLRIEVTRSNLSEKRARLSLDEARLSLMKANSEMDGSIEKTQAQREAALRLEEAQENLSEAQRRSTKAAKDNREAQAKGVEGSDDVVDAHKEITSSSAEAKDAIKDMGRTHEDLARQTRDDAIRIVDAQQSIIDIQRRQAELSESTSKKNVTASNNVKEAMDKLPPSGQAFVEQLIAFRPEIDKLKKSAGEDLFPGLSSGLSSFTTMLPTVNKILKETGGALGDIVASSAKMIASGPFTKDLGEVAKTNTTAMVIFGEALNKIIDGFRHVAVAAQPLVLGLAEFTKELGETFRASMEAGRNNGSLAAFFEKTLEVTKSLIHTIGGLYSALKGIGRAAMPLGTDMVGGMEDMMKSFARWTNSVEGQSKLRGFFDGVKRDLKALGGLVKQTAQMFGRLFGKDLFTGGSNLADVFNEMARLIPVIEPVLKALVDKFKELFTAENIAAALTIFGAFKVGQFDAVLDVLGLIATAIKTITDNPVGAHLFYGIAYLMTLNKFASLVPGVGLLKKSLMELVDVDVKKFATAVWSMSKDFAKATARMVATSAKWAASMIAKFVAVTASAIASAAATAFAWFMAALPFIAIGLAVAYIADSIINHWDEIALGAKVLWEFITHWFGKIVSWLWETFKQFHPLGILIAHFGDIADAAVWLWDQFVRIFTNISNFLLVTVPGWIVGAAKWLWQTMVNFGRNIWEGIAAGVSIGWGYFKKIWNWYVDMIPGSFADALKIQSPSRVMMTLGQQISAGLAEGIMDGIPLIDSAVGSALGVVTGSGSLAATVSASANGGFSSSVTGMTASAASYGRPGGSVYIDNTRVTVEGSVVTERGLADRMRTIHMEKGRNNVGIGLG